MRKLFVVTVLFLSLLTTVEARKIEGFIIRDNREIPVTFNIPFRLFSSQPDFERLQYRIRYYDDAGKKMILKPGEAQEIQFTWKTERVRMLSINNNLGLEATFARNNYVFLRLEIDGPMRLFKYYYTRSSGGGYYGAGMGASTSYTTENLYLQKGDGELKRPRSLNFRKDMTEYLSDCPSLVEKIQGKDFRRKDLEFIVLFYNKQCQ